MSAPRSLETLTGSRRAGADLIISYRHRKWCSGCARERTGRARGDGGVSRRLPAAKRSRTDPSGSCARRALSAEYRALRAKVNFEALTRTPDLAAEVTLQPLRRFELDAAILFSDIMTPLQGMGVDLAFEPGPVVREPIRTDAQIDALPALVPQRDVPFVLETIRLVRANVPRAVPLIASPARLSRCCATRVREASKEFAAARTFLYAQPHAAQRLLERLATPWRNILRRRRGRGPGAHAVRVMGGAARRTRVHAVCVAGGAAHGRWATAAPACPSSTT